MERQHSHIHQKWWSSPKFFDDLCLATWSTWLLFSWFPFFISTTTPLHNTVNSLLQSKSHFVNEFTSLWTESLSGHTVVDTTAAHPRSVSCRQLYSCSLCSSLRYTNSYSRFLHIFHTIGEIQNRKFKILCTNLGWFAQLWSIHSQFQ